MCALLYFPVFMKWQIIVFDVIFFGCIIMMRCSSDFYLILDCVIQTNTAPQILYVCILFRSFSLPFEIQTPESFLLLATFIPHHVYYICSTLENGISCSYYHYVFSCSIHFVNYHNKQIVKARNQLRQLKYRIEATQKNFISLLDVLNVCTHMKKNMLQIRKKKHSESSYGRRRYLQKTIMRCCCSRQFYYLQCPSNIS